MDVSSPPVFPDLHGKIGIFLAGSIEMGLAKDWQYKFIKAFKDAHAETTTVYPKGIGFDKDSYKHVSYPLLDRYHILNPRRENWNNDLKQSIKEAEFYQQVMWELEYLERVDHRVFYFATDTLSPISLLELGKFHSYPNTYVCWEPGYRRQGNLEVFCHKYNIRHYDNYHGVIRKIMNLERKHKNFTDDSSRST